MRLTLWHFRLSRRLGVLGLVVLVDLDSRSAKASQPRTSRVSPVSYSTSTSPT